MRNLLAMGLLVGLVYVLPAQAATCPGTVILQDAFNSANPALDVNAYASSKMTIQGGTAAINMLQANSTRADEYVGSRFGDVNACVTLASGASDKSEGQVAGLIFWANDYTALYLLEVNPASGQFAVAQRSEAGAWSFPVAWAASAAVVEGMGKANTLRVQTKGASATLFINDQQVGTFTGTPPASGGMVGFYAESESSMTASETWDFTNFSASAPETVSSPVASAECPGTVVFQDEFPSPDSQLNVQTGAGAQLATQGGKADLSILQANISQAIEYAGNQFGDASVCATVNTLATDKAEGQSAGLIFWAADYNNYYIFEVNPTAGQFEVTLRSGGNWGMVMISTPMAAITKGMGKTNTLRVQTKGTEATLYVNNQQVGTIYGDPPAGGGLVGFYAESETAMTAKETWEFGNFMVAVP